MSANVLSFPLRLQKNEPLWLVLTTDELAEISRGAGGDPRWMLRQIMLKKSILLSHASDAALTDFLRQIEVAALDPNPDQPTILYFKGTTK